VPSAERSALAAGTLALTVTDDSVLGPLRWFAVRIANESRYASERGLGSTELSLPLTPGTYTVVVAAPGYETVEIPNVVLAGGDTTRPPSIQLQPGSGRIHGQVIGNAPPEHRFNVELRGDGRHPCERCCKVDPKASDGFLPQPPCGQCGFARGASVVSVLAGDRFEFRNLASGKYVVRLSDGDLTISGPTVVVLAPGAIESVVFDATTTRSVDIDVLSAAGGSLSALWADRRDSQAPMAASDDVQPPDSAYPVTLAFLADGVEVAHTIFFPPVAAPQKSKDPEDAIREKLVEAGRRASIEDMMSRMNSDARMLDDIANKLAKREGRVVDRPRNPTDRLHPSSDDPHFETSSAINCAVGTNGVLTLGALPVRQLRVRVSTPWASAEADVPESRDTIRVSVRLRPQ
jgi:hypothetical protein